MAASLPLNYSLLVVDDEADLLDIIADTLSLSFTQVHRASDAAQAQEILKKEKVDILVTDYKMPKMNGLQLIEQCSKEYPELPAIMLTANADNTEVLAAVKAGSFDIIAKPFRSEILVHRIQQSLVLSQLIRTTWSLLKSQSNGGQPPERIEFCRLGPAAKLKILQPLLGTTPQETSQS
jgi:two-component system chemotaxis response regulator CheY